MIEVWFNEAGKYNVLPLDDRIRRTNHQRLSDRQAEPPRDTYIYYPGASEVPEAVAVSVRGRSYKILANVEIEKRRCPGRHLRPRLALRRARPVHQGQEALVRLQLPRHPAGAAVRLIRELTPGKYTLGMEFIKESTGEYGESHGTTKLYVNDEAVAEGQMRTQTGKFTLCGDGLCVGRDSGDAVSDEYKPPFAFKGGTIQGVAVSVGSDVYMDLEKQAGAMLARD